MDQTTSVYHVKPITIDIIRYVNFALFSGIFVVCFFVYKKGREGKFQICIFIDAIITNAESMKCSHKK